MSAKQLVWLITGTSTGLGRELALAVLARGDKVIATGRAKSISKVADLKSKGADVLELDVTDPIDQLHEFAKRAIQLHGRVDVLVNNAGYMDIAALEEYTPEETFNVFNTNCFAALNMSRAFLPYMRERKAGSIVWLGSVAGHRGYPTIALYAAAKHVVRALSQALHEEISQFGLRSICFEFGYFRTPFLANTGSMQHPSRIADYKEMTDAANTRFAEINGHQPGNPVKGVNVMVDVIRGEGAAAGRPFPTVLPLGTDCFETIKAICDNTVENLDTWEDVIKSTDLPKGT